MTDALLSPMIWLVAAQFVLYAVGWSLCGLLLREQRVAALYWAAFMALIGLGFVLNAQRGEPRTWLAFNGSGLLFVTGLLCLWRGLAAHFEIPQPDREHAWLLVLATVAMVLLGPGLANAPWRVLLTYGLNIYLLTRTVVTVHGRVRELLGARLSMLVSLPAALIVGSMAVPFLRQVVDMEQAVELHRFDSSNLRSMYFYIAAAAIFNFTFVALVTSRLLRRLRDLSERDALTGLFNRRALEVALQREWQRWRRGGDPFSVLLLDLDHFKRINDTRGHPAGDEVLQQTARRLQAQARDTDTVARFGGEEFLVLMPRSAGAGALAAAERLRRAVGETTFDVTGGTLAVTVSVGVAEVAGTDADVTRLLQRADQALYDAKHQGRNRSVLAAAA